MAASRTCIAIVDDDAGLNKALDRLLRSAGFSTCTFRSAEDFLDHSAMERHDCLILDIRLPGISGIELSRRLESEHKHVPTIFITGQQGDWECEQARHFIHNICLYKPFSDSTLLKAVNATLKSPLSNGPGSL